MPKRHAEAPGHRYPVSHIIEPSSKQVRIEPGGHRATNEKMVLSTILGSCVAACLYDEVSGIAGMNHFMLANRRYSKSMAMSTTDAGRYGIHAMELLINDMLKLGASRQRIKAKVFGGGRILETGSKDTFYCVGEVNQRFIREFLELERIETLALDLGGELGRVIHFRTDTFQVFRRWIKKTETLDVERKEHWLWKQSIEEHETPREDTVLFK
jgi:chemotaxis protein CheD